MDKIFKDIEKIGNALDKAKILELENAPRAKLIVDSCIFELQKISKQLGVMSLPPVSLKDSGAGF